MNPKDAAKTIGSILLTKVLFSPLGLIAVGITILLIIMPVFMSMASKGEDFSLDDPDSNLEALSGSSGSGTGSGAGLGAVFFFFGFFDQCKQP